MNAIRFASVTLGGICPWLVLAMAAALCSAYKATTLRLLDVGASVGAGGGSLCSRVGHLKSVLMP